MSDIDRAADAVRAGDLVVYPTETVYGLAADATDAAAVERVFAAKQRAPDKPVSVAVPSVAALADLLPLTDHERRFADEFLPGPVTLVVDRGDLPATLTGGGDRVGVRVPEHPLARDLLGRVAPVTATSANVSGRESARTVADLDAEIREAAAVVLDGGETSGGEPSTVVDVGRETVHRAGPLVDDIEAWLASQ
ncbi:L-threonylcarbamoyladenylate synthase [Halosegnis longus]|uniref:L-threonylcarbamoyladenylate synthase n=1 Tax=Halosegnis longus TaxID=2216012 RepID=UPI00129EDAFA|nr:L-threonylcarbamoyladenylate synthase [Halosegnis longus]